ncbi:hypothetical protein GCM10025781_17270 [Kocuria gwangalliensis]|uniref:Uncharacterized protein n=1 Tax=Kocuria gwangalliensis TaxID=501592 RepID=A0ABP8X6U5_9MICC
MNRDPLPPQPQACNHEAHRVKIHEWESIAQFISAAAKPDGLHVIDTGRDTHLDILTSGDPYRPASKPTLVIFNGAVTKRDERVPPFLSGRGIAHDTGWPFVAISDPSIGLSKDTSIAWYAGNSQVNLQREIFRLIRPLSRVQKNLWLVGGSAGGFAALVFGHMLGSAASVFVWNAQTDVLEYSAGYVKNYVKNSFPEIAGRMNEYDWKKYARNKFRRHNYIYSIQEAFLPHQRPRRILYLQNHNDWHVISHCVPYLNSFNYKRLGDGLYAQDENHVIWFPEIGNGHPAPHKDAILTILKSVSAPQWSLLDSVEIMEATGVFPVNQRSPLTRPRAIHHWGKRISDRIRIEESGRKITVTLKDLPLHYGGVSVGFASYVEGSRIDRQLYNSGLYEYTVPIKDHKKIIVRILVQDGFGNPLKSETIEVSSYSELNSVDGA